MTIGWRIGVIIWGLIATVSAVFSYLLYETQKQDFIEGTDKQLITGATMARSIVGADYHDRIKNKASVSPDEYLKIVDTYNKICLQSGFQYLWSNLFLKDGTIVFTSGTSSSKDIQNGDHALFFDTHSDPAAFQPVINSGKATFSTFHNEWGSGRMLLIPYEDRHGRTYVFGASISISELDARLQETAVKFISLFLIMLTVGSCFVYFLSRSISSPIQKLTQIAGQIASGEYGITVDNMKGGIELESLAHSINTMSNAIKTHDQRLRDHSEHLQELVDERTAGLTKAKEEAEHANKTKSEFLANMSHEIRTPINAVLGIANIGLRTSKDAADREHFERIHNSGQHLLNIVNDILDFSKIEAGKIEIENVAFPLASSIEESVAMIRERARQKSITLTTELAPDIPDWVSGDPLRFQQVLLNLLSNAIKFTDHGAVSIYVEWHEGTTCVQVRDSGIGMNEEQLSRLFKAFEQADSSTTRKYGGTGLGLAISYRLTRLMNGKLEVSSQPNRGSTFTLQLPMQKTAQPTANKIADSTQEHTQQLAGVRVLAAEDVDINRLILEDILTTEGAEVTFAEHGEQALDILDEKGAASFDVVLMDVQMPVMDGYEATQHINKTAPDLPVIGLTAHALSDEKQKCLDAGMLDHLTKPIDANALIASILRFSRPRRG